MNKDFQQILDGICERDLRYQKDAYEFVMEALNYTQRKFHRPKHVSGDQLLRGFKVLLLQKFGPLSMTVLQHWGINTTEDIGHIVFNLVENKILNKTEEDSLEHFRDGYDFEEVFNRGYRKKMEKLISRMR